MPPATTRTLTALLWLLASPAAFAVCDSDPIAVTSALFDGAASCDSNHDEKVSAADSVAVVAAITRPVCPGTAAVDLYLANRSAAEALQARFHGKRLSDDCSGAGVAEYEITSDCPADDELPCATQTNLAPGRWVHSVEVLQPEHGQVQHQRQIAIADQIANSVRFTAFASVLTVDKTTNGGAGSLRAQLQATSAAPKPALIQFDESVFPPAVRTTVVLTTGLPPLATSEVTIDGVDAAGRRGNRVVDADGKPFGVLSITGARNRLVGLRLRGAGANDRDVLNLSGMTAVGNVIDDCIIEDAASADGIGADAASGMDFSGSANIVRRCEVQRAADKGIKVTTGAFLNVDSSWIHDNVNGGVQATLGGHVTVENSLMENNVGGGAENGLSVQSAEGEASQSYLESRFNVSRRNGANGISVRAADAVIHASYFAANGTSGIRIFNDIGPSSDASIDGSTAACNQIDGAVVANTSTADFGGGALHSAGNNAFTQNDLPNGGANLRNATTEMVSATNNQWEHCGRLATCDEAAIIARDLNDNGESTVVSPAQAHRDLELIPRIDEIFPAVARGGDLVRIVGAGFNVIDGHFAEDQCADVAGRNRCVPLRGNCVRVGGVPAPVEAVTPTMLVIRWPFTCLSPVDVTVTVDKGSTGLTSAAVRGCEGE